MFIFGSTFNLLSLFLYNHSIQLHPYFLSVVQPQHRWDITILPLLPLYQELSNFQLLAGINYFLNGAGASRAWCQHCRNWPVLGLQPPPRTTIYGNFDITLKSHLPHWTVDLSNRKNHPMYASHGLAFPRSSRWRMRFGADFVVNPYIDSDVGSLR